MLILGNYTGPLTSFLRILRRLEIRDFNYRLSGFGEKSLTSKVNKSGFNLHQAIPLNRNVDNFPMSLINTK